MVFMVFSAVSMVSSFEADDDTHDLDGVGERNKTRTKQMSASLRNTDAVRSRMKEERGKFVRHGPQLLYPNRKETVR